ncbi:purine and uridine phosphorylase, partial [Sarocladium strictum]
MAMSRLENTSRLASSSRQMTDEDQLLSTRSKSTGLALAHRQYTVAWICPLQIELIAAMAMLDEVHGPLQQTEGDNNSYTLGRIAEHNVVIAGLGSEHGILAASSVSNDLRKSFPGIRDWFLVGIGGGVPSIDHDLWLGDVVVGRRVIPYDPKKQYQDSVLRTSLAKQAPDRLYKAATNLASRIEVLPTVNQILPILHNRRQLLPKHQRPLLPDRLFDAGYVHPHQEDTNPCQSCDSSQILARWPREENGVPKIHFGDIASGDTLLRSSEVREKLGREELKVACFDMEAAGLHRELPCLVIRGISDYADSHKNDHWKGFAAAVAAAYTRMLLEFLPSLASPQDQDTYNAKSHQKDLATQDILDLLKFDHIDVRRLNIEERHKNTCEWLLKDEKFSSWMSNSPSAVIEHQGLLWLRGNPGAGKSTLMKFAFDAHRKKKDAEPRGTSPELLVSFFFNARGSGLEKSVEGMYRALLVQILEQLPHLLSNILGDDHIPENRMLTLPVLKRMFNTVVSGLGTHHLICYIDALDECDREQIRDMMEHMQGIAAEMNQEVGRFRVFSSSRHYGRLEPRIGAVLRLDSLPGHTLDMASYIQDRLSVKNVPGLETFLLEKANGVFLWLVLVVKILNENEDHGISCNIEELEEELPDELYELFLLILKWDISKPTRRRSKLRGDNFNLDEFEVAITWILYGRGLSVDVFPHALLAGLAVKRGQDDLGPAEKHGAWPYSQIEKRVISATKGLAEVTWSSFYENRKVQFIHESVRTFLVDGELDKDEEVAALLKGSSFGKPSICELRLLQYCEWYL